MELAVLLCRAKAGDVRAFTEITRRYENLVFGYALSIVRDFHLAQDAAQEAFVAAYFGLESLQDAGAFSAWLRGIVRHQCHRILRKRHRKTVPLEQARESPARNGRPEREAEGGELRAQVLAAVAALPQPQREVITLYYLQERSQREIAAFLGVPVTPVNNRLHAARGKLKRRMLTMVRDVFKENGLPDNFAARIGKIVRVRGPVIEAQFDPASLPEVLSALTITDEPGQIEVTAEVAQRLEGGLVRCLATSPAAGLRRGMTVVDTGQPTRAPVADADLPGVVRLLGTPREKARRRAAAKAGPARLLDTGIKVIDLLCPFVKGGTVGIFGDPRIGKLALIEELVYRIAKGEGGLALFTFVQAAEVDLVREVCAKGPVARTAGAPVQTFYICAEDATDARRAAPAGLDTRIQLSRELSAGGIYPAVDPLLSTSRALEPGVVGKEHGEVAERVRQTLKHARLLQEAGTPAEHLAEEDRRLLTRATKLSLFFSQPFFIAERHTRVPGKYVSPGEAVQGCRAILEGEYDALPAEAFFFRGAAAETRDTGG